MEEEMLSVISSGEVNNATSNEGEVNNGTSNEVSDSISSCHHPANKRKRCGTNGTSSKFKGVMRQKNGQWGAQLYAKHSRIWLGTFKSEIDAAMAYDSAAIKFRTGDSHRNFPWTDITLQEPKFQSCHSAEAVLSMIRDGSYQSKFMDFLKAQSRRENVEIELNSVGIYSNNGLTCKQLFQKELTPSDVGKLNRLVIPKKCALKFFPPILGNAKEIVQGGDGSTKPRDAELVFYDKCMKLWKFRYCYWNSSQSFVFTRGWNLFLREKQLKANDMISFYVCEARKEQGVQRFCMIHVNKVGNDNALVQAANLQVEREVVDLQLRLGGSSAFDGEKHVRQEPGFMELMPKQVLKQEQEPIAAEPTQGVNTKGFKLFGIQIN